MIFFLTKKIDFFFKKSKTNGGKPNGPTIPKDFKK